MIETIEHLFYAATQASDPYAPVIRRFFQSDFPISAAVSKQDQLEILTAVLIGTSNTRYGPKPSPESLVAIRDVLRSNIDCNDPIPVLIPWGGRKTVMGFSVDVAEAVALKQLSCLQASVKKVYEPGLDINIRVEDTGAKYLYRADGLTGDTAVVKYTADFMRLIRVLNLGFINPIPESSLMDEAEYFNLSNLILEPMYDFLAESDAMGLRPDSKHYKALLELGWKGEIPAEQRAYYRNRYLAHEPELKPAAATQKLAEYFAGALARYRLKGTGVGPKWQGRYIQISFVPPVPGAPVALTSRNLYYRTIPEKISRNHMPAWRAKGYFKIVDDVASPRLIGFHEDVDLTPSEIELTRAGESVKIRTDYLLDAS